jgi:hypothetical protein
MATTPSTYQNNTPVPVTPNLSSLQLALVDSLLTNTEPAFCINQDFLSVMKTFASSEIQSPTLSAGNFAPGLEGVAYLSLHGTIYVMKVAEDCGPNETLRYQTLPIGADTMTGIRTWEYFGGPIYSGTAASGTSWTDGADTYGLGGGGTGA